MLGQGVAVLINGFTAHGGSGIVEGMAVLFGYLIQHPERLFYDLRAGAIAPDDSNIFFHRDTPFIIIGSKAQTALSVTACGPR